MNDWQDIVKIFDRRPSGPQPLLRDPPPKLDRTRSKTKDTRQMGDRTEQEDSTEDATDVAPQTKDECECRNPMCNMRATWKCRNCGHQSCDIHKEILESFVSPTSGRSAKTVHNFQPWDCNAGQAGEFRQDRSQID